MRCDFLEFSGIVKGFYPKTPQHKRQNQKGDDRFLKKIHDRTLPKFCFHSTHACIKIVYSHDTAVVG